MANEMSKQKITSVTILKPRYIKVGTQREYTNKGFSVTVSIPETVEVRMADASVLVDCQSWFYVFNSS